MNFNDKNFGRTEENPFAPLIGVVLVGGIAAAASLSLRMAPWIGGPEQDVTWHPVELSLRLCTGKLVWTGQATAAAVGLGVTACGMLVAVGLGLRWISVRRWRSLVSARREKAARRLVRSAR